jgi:protein gp37
MGNTNPQYLRKTDARGKWTGKVECCDWLLDKPLHWRKPCKIFVCSMGDLFHQAVPTEFIYKVFDVMKSCPQHTFLVLTKRPQRMSPEPKDGICIIFKNIWLGVSVENQKRADERIPILLQIPAAKRFVSIEPMLGLVDLERGRYFLTEPGPRLDWVILGGESGPKARPMNPDWVRSVRDQCKAAGVPFFFKQWGEWYPCIDRDTGEQREDMVRLGKKKAGCLLDGAEHKEMAE